MGQHEKIIKMLKANKTKGVPNYRFPQERILNYKARVHELRQDGPRHQGRIRSGWSEHTPTAVSAIVW